MVPYGNVEINRLLLVKTTYFTGVTSALMAGATDRAEYAYLLRTPGIDKCIYILYIPMIFTTYIFI